MNYEIKIQNQNYEINEIKNDVYSSFKENFTIGNNRCKTKLPFKGTLMQI